MAMIKPLLGDILRLLFIHFFPFAIERSGFRYEEWTDDTGQVFHGSLEI